MIALEFPPINGILRWKDLFPTFNKIGLIAVLAVIIGSLVFFLAGRKGGKGAPRGIRNFAESIVEFIENGIIMQTMGKQGLKWTPFLLSLFVFIYLCNVPGIIPFFQMPATARVAVPMMLSLTVWATFIGVGLKHQGAGYFGHLLWPPGVPTALKPLVGAIEFISTIIVTPFSLTVRLMANMLAGHILLVTFAILTKSLIEAETNQVFFIPLGVVGPFVMLVGVTAFEVLVGFLQAYIFTILTAVYINNSMVAHGDDH